MSCWSVAGSSSRSSSHSSTCWEGVVEKLAAQNDLEAVNQKCKRALEGRDAAVRHGSPRVCRSLTEKYGEVFEKMREKRRRNKVETAAEISLEGVKAKIDVISEYLDGGFELEEELARLRRREISCYVNLGAVAVSDSSLGSIELSEVSDDSVNQDVDDAVDQIA
ncbi:hypothetical protein Bca101_043936 [Brassica carinata]